MFCGNCGNSVADGNAFCPSCGASMAVAAPAVNQQPVPPTYTQPVGQGYGPLYTPPKKKKTGLIVGLISGVVVVAALIVVLVMFVFGGSGNSIVGYWELDEDASDVASLHGIYFMENGTCTVHYPEELLLELPTVQYEVKDGKITLFDDNNSTTANYTIKDGVLTIDSDGELTVYKYIGGNTDNAFANYVPYEPDEPADTTDAAPAPSMPEASEPEPAEDDVVIPAGFTLVKPETSPYYVIVPDSWIVYGSSGNMDAKFATDENCYVDFYYFSGDEVSNDLALDIEYQHSYYDNAGEITFETINGFSCATFNYAFFGDADGEGYFGVVLIAADNSGNEVMIDGYFEHEPSIAEMEFLDNILRTLS